MSRDSMRVSVAMSTLNESPSEKEGKFNRAVRLTAHFRTPSMKVPPKRKGNHRPVASPYGCMD